MSVNEILSQGASYLVSQDIYEDYIQGKDVTLGRPTGSDTVVWVSPNDSINEVLIKSNGDPRIMEELLGLDEFSLGDNPVRIDIDNTNEQLLMLDSLTYFSKFFNGYKDDNGGL